MYDKVNIYLESCFMTEEDKKKLMARMDTETRDKKTGAVSMRGKLEGISLRLTEGALYATGSISKYYLGDNLFVLDRGLTREAVVKLQDDLEIANLLKSRVTFVEFGNIYSLINPIQDYLNSMGFLPRYKRGTHDDTLYYDATYQKVKFYDKRKEVIDKGRGKVIPISLGRNILRYEKTYKEIYKKYSPITLGDLYDYDTYKKFVDDYITTFHNIQKIPAMKPTTDIHPLTASQCIDIVLAYAMEKADVTDFIQKLVTQLPNRQERHRAKKKFEEITTNTQYATDEELIKELNEAVENVRATI